MSGGKYINPFTDFGFKTHAEISKLSKEERRAYEASLKIMRDYDNCIQTAAAEAAAEAETKKAIEIAKNMKASNFDVETIAKLTNLSIEEINKI